MNNGTSDISEAKKDNSMAYDVKLSPSPLHKSVSDTNTLSIPQDGGMEQRRLSTGSPTSRRQLPHTPLSTGPKSSDEHDTLMRKFRYDTIARNKKDSKNKQRNSSTFYLLSDIDAESNMTAANSEPNLAVHAETPSTPSSSSRHSFSPLFRMKSTSPLSKIRESSPLSKIKDNDSLHNHTLKKKAAKMNSISATTEKQTHVALYKFIPRHKDELPFMDGDPIHVIKMYDDLWYEGINISTGKQGVFPCRYVADILAQDVDASIDDPADHKQFHVRCSFLTPRKGVKASTKLKAKVSARYDRFLGSVEVQDHKGDEILMYAIARVVNQRSMLSSANPPTCVLQVSSTGVRICNMAHGGSKPHPQVHEPDRKTKKGKHHNNHHEQANSNEPADETHYFSLKNVTFCGNHPKDKRYFGFITKHPDEHRFACHVLMSKYSTDPIAKIFGECFEKFYTNFLEYRASTEDIYLE